MKNYKFWLTVENLIPVKFYPYTSIVMFTLLSQNHNYKTEEHDFLEILGNEIKQLVEQRNIYWDNKVVIECKLKHLYPDQKATSSIFIGKYDGKWFVGLGVLCDSWIDPIEIK